MAADAPGCWKRSGAVCLFVALSAHTQSPLDAVAAVVEGSFGGQEDPLEWYWVAPPENPQRRPARSRTPRGSASSIDNINRSKLKRPTNLI